MPNDFHEIRFPLAISLGGQGGPERRTEIVTLGSGRERRNARWAHARRLITPVTASRRSMRSTTSSHSSRSAAVVSMAFAGATAATGNHARRRRTRRRSTSRSESATDRAPAFSLSSAMAAFMRHMSAPFASRWPARCAYQWMTKNSPKALISASTQPAGS